MWGKALSVYKKCVFWGWRALLVCLVFLNSSCEAPSSASTSTYWFAATGHSVSGKFLSKFQSAGGLETLGYPITEPFEQEGRLVQYFEYACLEDHPDNPGGPVVKLRMLGERMGRRQPALDIARVPGALERHSRYFSQTGHAVRRDFLDYFDARGGLDLFGFPVSEPFSDHGVLVQDFQRIRLVWVPSGDWETSVLRETTGQVEFVFEGLDITLLRPIPRPADAEIVP